MVFSSSPQVASQNGGAPTTRSLHDAASVVGSRIHELASQIRGPETRNGLRESWDSLVRVVFSPCAGDIGGVPREEVGCPEAGRSPLGVGGRGKGAPPPPSWGASVPFEVSASQDKTSSLLKDSSFASSQHTREVDGSLLQPVREQSWKQPQMIPEQRALTPREQRKAQSRAKLRQLGAQHRIASGLPSEGIADAARPISPVEREQEVRVAQEAVADVVDFDDGISAISSHTLEEMERRRLAGERHLQIQKKRSEARERARGNVVRLHPLDFTQIIDEEAEFKVVERGGRREEGGNAGAEVVFGKPFYDADARLRENIRTVVDEGNGIAHDEFIPHPVGRVTTNQSKNTTVTEESHEFEEMYRRHEATYWLDQSRVDRAERSVTRGVATGRTSMRQGRGVSIEERARRLRELSRSRSRSDGTGSSNKSGTSSLVSDQHPHDTVPVYSSDLFSRRKKTRSKVKSRESQGKEELVPGSKVPPSSPAEGSDPFSSLDYGEI